MSENTFEDKTRLAILNILVHLHKTWGAFSEAAARMHLTPEQAEASLLAKAVLEISEEPPTDEERIGNYLKTSFVLSAVGLLPSSVEEKLDAMTAEFGASNWKDAVGADLALDADGIRRVHAACAGVMTVEAVVHFILRGLRVVPSIDALVHAAKARAEVGGKKREKRRG